MLRPWLERVVAYLGPTHVSLMRTRAGIRTRLVECQSVKVDGDFNGDPSAVLASLGDLYAQGDFGGVPVRVVVSNAWVRYGIVPAPAVALNADGRISHARYVLSDLYGDDLAEWHLTLSDTPPGRAYIACAMPEKIESHLDAVFAPNQKRLVSIQPELAFTFNLWRKALPREPSWYVSLDEYSLTAVLIEDGHWSRVHMTRTHSKWQVELKRLLGLSRLTAGLNGTLPVYIDSIKAIRDEGGVEFSDLHWLDSDSATRNLPALTLLGRVAT